MLKCQKKTAIILCFVQNISQKGRVLHSWSCTDIQLQFPKYTFRNNIKYIFIYNYINTVLLFGMS